MFHPELLVLSASSIGHKGHNIHIYDSIALHHHLHQWPVIHIYTYMMMFQYSPHLLNPCLDIHMQPCSCLTLRSFLFGFRPWILVKLVSHFKISSLILDTSASVKSSAALIYNKTACVSVSVVMVGVCTCQRQRYTWLMQWSSRREDGRWWWKMMMYAAIPAVLINQDKNPFSCLFNRPVTWRNQR